MGSSAADKWQFGGGKGAVAQPLGEGVRLYRLMWGKALPFPAAVENNQGLRPSRA